METTDDVKEWNPEKHYSLFTMNCELCEAHDYLIFSEVLKLFCCEKCYNNLGGKD